MIGFDLGIKFYSILEAWRILEILLIVFCKQNDDNIGGGRFK